MYVLGSRSKRNLEGVHPDLVQVIKLAITKSKADFTVIEGLRTKSRQRELYNKGFSKTMDSRHLTGHAVDVVPYPIAHRLSYPDYMWNDMAEAIIDAADELGVDLEWGYAEWGWDKPHFQLSRESY